MTEIGNTTVLSNYADETQVTFSVPEREGAK